MNTRTAFATAFAMIASAAQIAQAATDDIQLEEVVVTAQKREQGLLDVGISIAVISGEELAQLRVGEIGDVSRHVSNMNVKNTLGATNPVVTIRGVGLNDFNANSNPTAGRCSRGLGGHSSRCARCLA